MRRSLPVSTKISIVILTIALYFVVIDVINAQQSSNVVTNENREVFRNNVEDRAENGISTNSIESVAEPFRDQQRMPNRNEGTTNARNQINQRSQEVRQQTVTLLKQKSSARANAYKIQVQERLEALQNIQSRLEERVQILEQSNPNYDFSNIKGNLNSIHTILNTVQEQLQLLQLNTDFTTIDGFMESAASFKADTHELIDMLKQAHGLMVEVVRELGEIQMPDGGVMG